MHPGEAAMTDDMNHTSTNHQPRSPQVFSPRGAPQNPDFEDETLEGDDIGDIDNSNLTLSEILQNALEQGAADVILTAFTEPVFKINGEVVPIKHYGKLSAPMLRKLERSMMDEEQIKELEEKHQIDFSLELVDTRWRVNIAGQRRTNFITMRVIPTLIKTFEELQLPEMLKEVCKQPRGLVLVTGPTGSGKSTTLAAMINYINRNFKKHIVTIEDPIEFVHPNIQSIINQREIGADATSFKEALKAVLRQAPDVILVGEMRDTETMEAAMTAAETGHLVMGTLHTNSAPATVDRIIDAFPEGKRDQVRIQLANNLLCVMSQTLASKRNGQGRVMVYEIMRRHVAISSAIKDGKTNMIHDTMRANQKDGMNTLDDMLYDLYTRREINREVAVDLAIDKKDMDLKMGTNK